MRLVPSINANIFTTSAFIIGILLTDDATPAEQNSLGGWFMLIGQVLSTNSAQQQVLNNRNSTSNTSNQHTINSNARINENINDTNIHDDINNQINMINKVIKAMQQEIDNLKKTF